MRRLGRLGADALLILIATTIAIMVRSDLEIYSSDFVAASTYLCATLIIGLVAVGASGLDLGFWRYASVEDAVRIILVAAGTVIGALLFAFLVNRLSGVARSVPFVQFALIATFLLVARLIARARHRLRQKSRPQPSVASVDQSEEHVLLIGMGALAETFLRCLTGIGDRTVRVVGIVRSGPRQAGWITQHFKVLGTPTGIDDVIQALSLDGIVIDRIVVALPSHEVTQDIRDRLARLGDGRSIKIDYLAERFL